MDNTRDSSAFEAAMKYFEKTLSLLETTIETKLESQGSAGDYEEEVQRMNADRSQLALALDQSETRAERLEVANRDVSKRLITTMEMIRAAVEQ